MQLQCWWLAQAEQRHLDLDNSAVASDLLIQARKHLMVSSDQLQMAGHGRYGQQEGRGCGHKPKRSSSKGTVTRCVSAHFFP